MSASYVLTGETDLTDGRQFETIGEAHLARSGGAQRICEIVQEIDLGRTSTWPRDFLDAATAALRGEDADADPRDREFADMVDHRAVAASIGLRLIYDSTADAWFLCRDIP